MAFKVFRVDLMIQSILTLPNILNILLPNRLNKIKMVDLVEARYKFAQKGCEQRR